MVLCVGDQRALIRYHSLQRTRVSEQEVNTYHDKSFNRTAGVLTDRKGSDAVIIQGNEGLQFNFLHGVGARDWSQRMSNLHFTCCFIYYEDIEALIPNNII